ncbi:hypothetical protein [Pseudactinotalea sp.]|uniref:hypothetical protein n=1 Tax=Pseudactinotalea sp. TaxID=1926260 RepID=UPI003B3A0945
MSETGPPRVYLRSHVGRRVFDEQLRAGHWTRVRPGACIATPQGERWEVQRQRGLGRCVAASRQLPM